MVTTNDKPKERLPHDRPLEYNPLADVVEICECRIKDANRLLKEGWELLKVESCSQMRDAKDGNPGWVQRFPGYILIKRA